MIRFNILKLLDNLEAKRGKKYTLKEVSEKSGCDKNALSRMVNHPEVIPSAKVIDQLVQFFFFELTRDEEKPHLDKNRIKKVINNFITVYPDQDEFWSILPPEIRNNPDAMPLDAIWSVYTRLHTPVREKPAKETEIRAALKAKILEAEQSKQEGSEIELSLSHEEFELLRKNLPQNMGGQS